MHTCFKRFLASAALACFPLVFSACGGGGGDTAETTVVSGVAMKGPIKQALVQVYKLNSDGTKGELLGSGLSDGGASYAIPVPKEKAVPPLLVTVTGQAGAKYTSETTGNDVAFTAEESFNAVLDTYDVNKKYTISPLTDAAYQQLQKFLTDSPTATADTRIISAANARVATLFGVSDILADPATDPAYSASLKIIDQMITSTGTASTLQTMSLINQGFVDVNSKAYQNYVTELISAANTVKIKDPAIANNVGTIVATAIRPPAEPVWTDTTAPNAVSSLQAVSGSDAAASFVSLYWNVATTKGKNPVTGYDIYRDGVKIASVLSTSYTDKQLALTTTYKYYVVAFDAAGNRSLPSTEVSASTPAAPNLNITVGGQLSSDLTSLPFKDINPPAAPLNLVAIATAINASTSSVRLTWSAATDNVAVSGYDVYRDGNKLGTTSVPLFTDPSTTSGVAHSYTVIAFDAAGNRSAASGALSVTPIAPNLGINAGGQVTP